MPAQPITNNDQGLEQARSLSGRLRKHERFISRILEQHHDLLVYVPPGYDAQREQHFPVLYMQDGQNLFDPETAFVPGNYWHMGETADALIERGAIQPLIIVGIYNSGVKRIDEYTPVADQRLGGGHADDYGRMLVEELKPFIDAQYRTRSGAEHCGIGGSSLGGLVSLYFGLLYPSIFSRLAVMSPSVWWRKRSILNTVAELAHKPQVRIWLDIGMKESAQAVPDARLLRDQLTQKGWRLGDDLAYTEDGEGEHSESAWARRTGPMLQFLFPRTPGEN